MKSCLICKYHTVKTLIDLGNQPVSSHYSTKKNKDKDNFRYPLILGQCINCGLIQSLSLFPVEKLIPKYDWVVQYSEPENHLDRLAKIILNLPQLTKDAKILGVSFKDETLLTRLRKLGFTNSYNLNTRKDLGISTKIAGIESVQSAFTPLIARKMVKKIGKQKIIIARHILEHAYNPLIFIDSLKELLVPSGYIIMEVPGNDTAINYFDYTVIWEEHTLYFTRNTFENSFRYFGLTPIYKKEFIYPLENSLIAITQICSNFKNNSQISRNSVKNESRKGNAYASQFQFHKKKWRKFFSHNKNAVLFGAGHLACGFVNYFSLKDKISFFIDDDPHKNGMLMAGSKLPIYPSSSLLKNKIKICLMSLNPRNEERVIQKHKEFEKKRGRFLSIFPVSSHRVE